jgi:oligopeptide transport system permease protein
MKKIRNYFNRKPLVAYVFKRIGSSMFTLFLVVTAIFLLLTLVPKERYIDRATIQKLPPELQEDTKQRIYDNFGLNDPVIERLFKYYYDVLPIPKTICLKEGYAKNDAGEFYVVCREEGTVLFNFGRSIRYKYGKPVGEFLAEKFPISMMIGLFSLIISYAIGYPLGVMMAKHKNGFIDKAGNAYIVFLRAVPGIVYFYIFIILAMVLFKAPTIFSLKNPRSWVAPITALSILSSGGTAMWVRRFMVDEMNADYVKFARSKGLPENKIFFVHILRNAVVPLARSIPISFIFTIIGSYFVERLWAIPGSGSLLIGALQRYDTPLILAISICYASLSMAAFLIGDLTTVVADPRVSFIKNK